MRFGYWLPVFGGWLRNVGDEGMEASWAYVKKLAQRSEQIGFDVTLIAELNLNDIKGVEANSLDAWSTAAALAAITERIELMVAVRPTFHLPALLAKQAANIETPGEALRPLRLGDLVCLRGRPRLFVAQRLNVFAADGASHHSWRLPSLRPPSTVLARPLQPLWIIHFEATHKAPSRGVRSV